MTNVNNFAGLPVTDAIDPILLAVTRADVRGASRKDPANCPIARAFRRQEHVAEARIFKTRAYLRAADAQTWTRYQTPKSAWAELIAIDRGGKFQPGEFRFAAVTPSNAIGTPRRGGVRTGTGQPRTRPHIVTDVRAGPAINP